VFSDKLKASPKGYLDIKATAQEQGGLLKKKVFIHTSFPGYSPYTVIV
jgi:hypothetical protein